MHFSLLSAWVRTRRRRLDRASMALKTRPLRRNYVHMRASQWQTDRGVTLWKAGRGEREESPREPNNTDQCRYAKGAQFARKMSSCSFHISAESSNTTRHCCSGKELSISLSLSHISPRFLRPPSRGQCPTIRPLPIPNLCRSPSRRLSHTFVCPPHCCCCFCCQPALFSSTGVGPPSRSSSLEVALAPESEREAAIELPASDNDHLLLLFFFLCRLRLLLLLPTCCLLLLLLPPAKRRRRRRISTRGPASSSSSQQQQEIFSLL